jgi:glycosyltransferase involved in cell wall biosynthesis
VRWTFTIVTRDHDTDGVRYGSVRSGAWNSHPAGAIYHAPRLTRRVLETCIRDTSADVVWLNSFFSRASLRVLLARRFGRVTVPVLLSPRGELSPGALSLKRVRKAVGVWGLHRLGFLGGLRWIASSDLEADDIRDAVGASAITVVPESVAEPSPSEEPAAKKPGVLRMIFASRIDAKKNLQFLLEALRHCRGRIHLDIIGPVEHPAYWSACRGVIDHLPANVTVTYGGELPSAELTRRLRQYDVMALPTLGENFGHAIVEAWAAGCPVLISDRTPWRNLTEDGGGWDLPLDPATWIAAIERCVTMDAVEHGRQRLRALDRARRVWQAGIGGAEALRALIVTAVRRDGRTETVAPIPSEHERGADPTPCG